MTGIDIVDVLDVGGRQSSLCVKRRSLIHHWGSDGIVRSAAEQVDSFFLQIGEVVDQARPREALRLHQQCVGIGRRVRQRRHANR